MRFSRFILSLALTAPAVAGAQRANDTLDLSGRSAVLLGVGLTGTRETTVATNQGVQTHTSGALGSLAFRHFVSRDVAVEIGVGNLKGDETAGVNSAGVGYTRTNEVVPLLFGVSVSPRALAISAGVRPFLSALVGPYIHATSETTGSGSSTRLSAFATTESVPGARFGLGANWFVSRHFIADIEGDYHAVGKFDHPDDVTTPSGFGLSVGLGFSWGGKY